MEQIELEVKINAMNAKRELGVFVGGFGFERLTKYYRVFGRTSDTARNVLAFIDFDGVVYTAKSWKQRGRRVTQL